MRPSIRALDRRFYRAHNRLNGVWRKDAVRIHYAWLGRRAGLQPHPLFDPAFVRHELSRVLDVKRPVSEIFDDYLSRPEMWSLDPHPDVFLPHESFASREPKANPLQALEVLPAAAAPPGYGHPMLDPDWWIERHQGRGLRGDSPLGVLLRDVVVRVAAARREQEDIALGPDPDVLFINGEDHCPACTQYRVWSPAAALRANGLRVAVVNARDLHRLEGVRVNPSCVIAFRALGKPELLRFLSRCRLRGIPIGFDCDDLLFGPPQAVGLQADRHGFRDVIGANRHAERTNLVIDLCDFAVVPTETLAEVLVEEGLAEHSVRVVPSFLSPAQLEAATVHANSSHARMVDKATLVAASGTWTHHEDFKCMVIGARDALIQNPSLELRFVGATRPADFPELAMLGDRVSHDASIVRDWAAYTGKFSGAIASLVPLDVDNGFCQGKSEVKYIEAGVVGTPTIASPSEAYRRALTSRGSLATTPADWTTSITVLARESSHQAGAGEKTRQDVLARYGPDGVFAQQYVQAVRSTSEKARTRSKRGADPAQATAAALEPSDEMLDLLVRSGAAGWLLHREPRAPDSFVPTAGTASSRSQRIIWSIPDALSMQDLRSESDPQAPLVAPPPVAKLLRHHGLSVDSAIPWADPRVFYARSGMPRGGTQSAVLIFPPARPIEAEVTAAMRIWHDWAVDLGWNVVVVGASRSETLLRAQHWTQGSSQVELATLLRMSSLSVQLSSEHWDPIITGAAVTSPAYAVDERAMDDPPLSLPPGWITSPLLGLAEKEAS